MKPKISVCVPTYNSAEFLQECLDSIIAQTFSQFELLVVDNHSSDHTLEIVEKYASKDSRIKVIKNTQNIGLVGNLNRCIDLAEGEWIKFVFSDDIIAPTCLEKMLAATELGKPIIYCRRNFIFEAGTLETTKEAYLAQLSVQNPFSDIIEISAQQYAEVTLKNIGRNPIGEPTSLLLHCGVFKQFGFFNPHMIMSVDIEFFARVAVNTGIVQIPEVLAYVRVHNNTTSADIIANRSYRGAVLDELIMVHDFAFHKVYAPIRTVAQQCHPAINLVQMFKQRTFSAWKIALLKLENTKISASSPHIELKKVAKYYPLISLQISVLYIKNYLKRVLPIAHIKAKLAKSTKVN